MRELSRTQTALFLCTGANLTLRNCSITILNQAAGMPLTLDTHRGRRAASPTHVRLEGCLIRGALARTASGSSGGPCEVVLRDSVVVAGGGPLVRFDGADAASESRIFLVQSLVAGPGPIIESTAKTAGRLEQAPGDPRVRLGVRPPAWRGHRQRDLLRAIRFNRPSKQFDWSGEDNLFAGWKGFFACGDDQTVTVTDLAAARSTWNGTDLVQPGDPRALGAPRRPGGRRRRPISRRSSPSHRAILERVARPRAGLYEKAVARLQRSRGAGAGGMDVSTAATQPPDDARPSRPGCSRRT